MEGFDLSAFYPRVGKNYIAPHITRIPNGTTYEKRNFTRPVILIAVDPVAAGTIYIYPHSAPVGDTNAIPITGGMAFLDGIGDWYIRHSGGSTQEFRIIDAGGAGNAQAVMLGASLSSNVVVSNTPVTWGTPVAQTINAADSAVAAANSSRRALALFNASTAGQRIAVTSQNPATAVIGFAVLDAGQGVIFGPLDCVTRSILRGWASAAGGSLIVAEGT